MVSQVNPRTEANLGHLFVLASFEWPRFVVSRPEVSARV
jgi:hypothetical protein